MSKNIYSFYFDIVLLWFLLKRQGKRDVRFHTGPKAIYRTNDHFDLVVTGEFV